MSIETYKTFPLDIAPEDTLVDSEGNVVIAEDAGITDENVFLYEKEKRRLKKWEEDARLDVLGANDPFTPEVVIGPSTRLAERALALTDVSKRFAEYAQAIGFKKASVDPETRPELRKRIANLDLRANEKLSRSKYAVSQSKQEAILAPLLQRDALIAAGFPPLEVDEVVQETILAVRGAFGTDVGHEVRNKNVRGINPGEPEQE